MHDRILNGEFERKQGAKGVVMHEPLKDCPFCGGAASLHNDTDSPCWFVGCSNSACPIEPCHYADTEAEAIATWNRRTPTPVAVPLTDEQMYEARRRAASQLFDLALQWADNKIHSYQFANEAEKIVNAVARRVEAAHGIGIKGGQHGTE